MATIDDGSLGAVYAIRRPRQDAPPEVRRFPILKVTPKQWHTDSEYGTGGKAWPKTADGECGHLAFYGWYSNDINVTLASFSKAMREEAAEYASSAERSEELADRADAMLAARKRGDA